MRHLVSTGSVASTRTAIAIVDDHPPILHGMQAIFDQIEGCVVVISATTGKQFLDALRSTPADIAVVDLRGPGLDGFEVLRELSVLYPSMPALAFSFSDELPWIRRALDAGACGYVLKNDGLAKWQIIIHSVNTTCVYGSELGRASLALAPEAKGHARHDIPPRELEYLLLQCDPRDLTREQIADIMNVTRHAVDGYFRWFSRNCDVHSIQALIQLALRLGLWQPPGPSA